ncbi:EBP isomerase, partial [Upupa epops]|nr:EBP isomerase [Upupa epops]
METPPPPPHPYWPRSLVLPGYVPADWPGWQCAGAVAAAGAGLMALGWALGGTKGRGGASRSSVRRLALGWFLLCAGIHGVLEGYFSLQHRGLPAATGLLADIFSGCMWGHSQHPSRSDGFTVAMESVTAWVWGPLSLVTVLAFLRQHPSRYILQLLVSLGQLYGDVLYFMTAAQDGWVHSDPRPLYFWGYFVAINGIWLLVPMALLLDAGCQLAKAQRLLD